MNFTKTIKKRHSLQNGMTFIEIMITMVIVSILIGYGIPSFSTSKQNRALTSQINTLVSSILFARNEASLKIASPLVLCASSSGTSCDTNNWENGWIAFSDTDRNNQRNGTETISRVVNALGSNTTLRAIGLSNNGRVIFDSEGAPNSVGTFVLCDKRGPTFAKAVILNAVGLTRIAIDEDGGDGIVNNHMGGYNNVVCP